MSDCHEGRAAAGSVDGRDGQQEVWAFNAAQGGTRNKEGGKDRNKGGRRKVFSSSMWFRCDVAEPDPLSSPSRMIRLDVCTADRERKKTANNERRRRRERVLQLGGRRRAKVKTAEGTDCHDDWMCKGQVDSDAQIRKCICKTCRPVGIQPLQRKGTKYTVIFVIPMP